MSKIDAIDRLWASAITHERERIQVELSTHLKTIHGWNNEAVATVISDLRLDKPYVGSKYHPQCPVCNQSLGETVSHYGTNLHPDCADSLTKVIDQIIEEN